MKEDRAILLFTPFRTETMDVDHHSQVPLPMQDVYLTSSPYPNHVEPCTINDNLSRLHPLPSRHRRISQPKADLGLFEVFPSEILHATCAVIKRSVVYFQFGY